MKTQASAVVMIVAVGAFLLGTAHALRAAPRQPVRLTPDTTKYADGAPPGFTGGFGEQACDACHFDAPLNTKPGQLTITGVPERFVGGERYPLTITLSRPGMAMGGFQLAARMEDGGARAGVLAPGPGEEKRVTIERGSIQYVNQRLPGTTLVEPGTAKWTLMWTAPATTGAVVFHVAANASDKDEAARGDFIYTAVATSLPR